MKTILIVDDEKNILKTLSYGLRAEGYDVFCASSARETTGVLDRIACDMVLLDIYLPDMKNLDLLKKVKEAHPSCIVIMMSAHGTIQTAVEATRLGAFDFFEKPISLEKLLLTIQRAFEYEDIRQENEDLKRYVVEPYEMIGKSRVISELKTMIEQVAPKEARVLITGENGTGKELVARAIHINSRRNNKPFIKFNTAAIPLPLAESELFGHEKGAFTGAISRREGRFKQADGGTLFLDEIGDMSLDIQSKVLRVLEENEFERIGGNQTLSVDVRIISATNRNLKEEINKGNFREDLYYRLCVVPIHLKPLRERKEDIPELVEYFLNKFCSTHGVSRKKIDQDGIECLLSYNWPGNIRELKNIIERLIIICPEIEIPPETISDTLGVVPSPAAPEENSLKAKVRGYEKEQILNSLIKTGWNVSRTATMLGLERSHLYKKIRHYGLTRKFHEFSGRMEKEE